MLNEKLFLLSQELYDSDDDELDDGEEVVDMNYKDDGNLFTSKNPYNVDDDSFVGTDQFVKDNSGRISERKYWLVSRDISKCLSFFTKFFDAFSRVALPLEMIDGVIDGFAGRNRDLVKIYENNSTFIVTNSCPRNRHWRVCIVDFDRKMVVIGNSLESSDEDNRDFAGEALSQLETLFGRQKLIKTNVMFDIHLWHVPQRNGFDCGIYTILVRASFFFYLVVPVIIFVS